MMDSLSKCFNGLQERYESVVEAKKIYRDDLDLTLPLNGSEVSVPKKSRSLERAKRIDSSLRFEDGDQDGEDDQKTAKPLKPRKVVRFQLENNKIFEPKKEVVSFDLDQELKQIEKTLDEKEGSNKEEVVRVKIKMTKQEAQRLLSKCKDDSVLNFDHLVDQIGHVPVHQVQVALVVVPCYDKPQENGCWLSQLK